MDVIPTLLKKKKNPQGAWLAQSVQCLTLDFGLQHDLRVLGSSQSLCSAGILLEDSLSHLPPPLFLLTISLSFFL